MKKDKYKWTLPQVDVPDSPDMAEQERFGLVLADRLNCQDNASEACLSAEEMAVLLEGRANATNKDRLLAHLASCETCYKVYLLAADLHEDEVKGREARGKRLIFFRPLALAASLFIMVFFLYIFYQSNEIPKTSQQYMEVTQPTVADQVAPAPAAKTATATVFKDDEEEGRAPLTEMESAGGAGMPPGPEVRARVAEQPAKSLAVAGVQKPVEKDIASTKKDEADSLDKKGDVAANVSVDGLVEAKERAVVRHEEKKAATVAGKMKRESTVAPRFQSQKQAQLPVNVNVQQNVARTQVLQEPAPSEAQQTGSVVGVQQKLQEESTVVARIEQLNRFARSSRADMNASQLLALFSETMALVNQLKEAEEVTAPGSLSRFQPLIKVVLSGQSVVVFPNIDYFLSISQPGSVANQFFNLTLSGWCDRAGQCYRKDGLVPDWENKLVKRLELLQDWESLYPLLTGAFKEIATCTIQRLQK